MKKVLLASIVGLGLMGCGTSGTQTVVDPRCKAGAPCTSMGYYDALPYFQKYIITGADWAGIKAGGDPDNSFKRLFENWFYTGTKSF